MKGVKLNKNADLNSYSYSKHGVEFDGMDLLRMLMIERKLS